MNEQDIKKILNDLYAVDASLRTRETEIIAIIKTLAQRSAMPLDPEFAGKLRLQLLEKMSAMQMERKTNVFNFMRKNMRYVVSVLAVVVVAGVATGMAFYARNMKPTSVALLSGQSTVTSVGDRAFGSLGSLTGGQGGTAASAATEAAPSGAMSANASAAPKAGMSMAAAMSGQASSAIARPMVPPPTPQQQYVYTGNPFTQNKNSLNVLKFVPKSIPAGNDDGALANAGFGTIDLASFANTGVTNITFSEKQSFGYTINVDLQGGSVSISQNYDQWPHDNNPQPLTASDIPADASVIATADAFLEAHGVAVSAYGAPEVVNNNYGYAVAPVMNATAPAGVTTGSSGGGASAMMRVYYPDTVAVLYPMLANGMNVYTTDGTKIGVTVQINVRYNRVSDVYGLTLADYQASSYPAITDSAKILDLAEHPFFYPVTYMESASGDVGTKVSANEIDLGTPVMAYVQMYQSDANGNGSQFLVPAFVFPVRQKNGSAYPQNIVVPLIADFIQSPAIYNTPGSGIVPQATSGVAPAQTK